MSKLVALDWWVDAAALAGAAAAVQLLPAGSRHTCTAAAVAAAAYVSVGVAVRLLTQWRRQLRSLAMINDTPGPASEGAFGAITLRQRHSARQWDWVRDCYAQFCTSGGRQTWKLLAPPVIPMVGGTLNEIHTIDPRNIEHILKGNVNNYIKGMPTGRAFLTTFSEWLGWGIFTIDHGPQAKLGAKGRPDGGKAWYAQRSTAARIFTRAQFTNFYRDVFVENGRSLTAALGKQAGGEAFDAQRLMFAYTMDSFGKIAFGVDMGNLSGADTGFGEAFDGAHNAVFAHLFANFKALMLRETLPGAAGWLWERAVCQIPSAIYHEFRRHVKALDVYTYDVIARRKADPGLGKANDLLGLFISSIDESTGLPYSDKTLRDVVLSFIIAGRDTTACTLSWLWYELAFPENAEVLAELIAEVDRVLEGDEPTFEVIDREMPYLRGVVYETLRLHPIVPHTILTTVADDVWPDGTRVPAGNRVVYDTYTMCRDKARWGEDADSFKPSRWIPFKAPSPYEFPVFKGGPRICLGMNMAVFEASLAAAMVLQKFTLTLEPGHDYTYSRQATLSVLDRSAGKAQLMMRVTPRGKEAEESG